MRVFSKISRRVGAKQVSGEMEIDYSVTHKAKGYCMGFLRSACASCQLLA